MRITEETVRELLGLARLSLEPEEIARMCRDLASILAYAEKLDEVDTTSVPATAHVLDIATPLREDRVANLLAQEDAVRNAPEHDQAAIIVPRVIE